MESVLKRYFGYSRFRPYQKEIIQKILEGRDCLVVMATGSGKSLCYQIPPLVKKKTAVVISPLLSLMQDQVMSLKQRGIRAEYLGSTQTDRTAQSEAENGAFDILYMTPEKACLLPSRFWAKLSDAGICLLAVDEAHCISEWGHDFRKEYKQLHMLHDVLSDVPFVALTATATEKYATSSYFCISWLPVDELQLLWIHCTMIRKANRVRNDIVCSLNMDDPYIAVGSFDRQNLFYGVKSFNRSLSFVDELVREVSKYNVNSGSTIIYCTTVKETEQICESLRNAGIGAGIYHGQMGNKAREESHRAFIRDELQVMVATIAFGMGIDKPNIRCVIHYGCPKSLESYYQESGRCGRDGLASICWLYYSRSDFVKADFYCGEAQSVNERKTIMESLLAAERYCMLATCRRKFLLQYFGEKITDDCGNCDNCTGSKRERDLSGESFLLLSCIKSCGGRWGLNMPIDILRGSRSRKILDNNFDKLPVHASGKDYSSNWWKALAALLIAHDYLKENIQDVYRTVSVSPRGMQFLRTANTRNRAPLILALTTEMVGEEDGALQSKVGDLQNLSAREYEEFSEAERRLYHMLLDIRMKLAQNDGTAPYAICGDQTIKKIAKIRPSTRARLANIDGVDQHLVTKYGESFLQNISQLSQELNLRLDGSTPVQTTSTKRVYPSSQRNLIPAKFHAWKYWQKDGYSFQKIANLPMRPAPIKEQTVIGNILEAAREGCEVDWTRFSEEIGLTLDMASQIRCAITEVGSRDRLKPIKEALPENVGYEHIKAFLTMEELGLSAEKITGQNSVGEFPIRIPDSQSPCIHIARTDEESSHWKAFIRDRAAPHPTESINKSTTQATPCGSKTFLCTKQPRSGDSLLQFSPKKLCTVSGQGEKCSEVLEATESAVLEWVRSHDGVTLLDIVEHFGDPKKQTVIDLLAYLEGEFLIFKKNDLYKTM